jgi:hypothetical protein
MTRQTALEMLKRHESFSDSRRYMKFNNCLPED